MGKYAKEQWYIDHLADMVASHGDMPPPWVYAENSHPYSGFWRMGSGEAHVMALDEWWENEQKTFDERIDYFRKWPAPPRWCAYMADMIWDLDPFESGGDFDYSEYFSRLKELGFEGLDAYQSDLERDDYD